jgi:hypothetical protein
VDELWRKILELAIGNTIAHNKRVDVLAELYMKNVGNKDPIEALKVLKEFKKETDDNIEKLLTLPPRLGKNQLPQKPPIENTIQEKINILEEKIVEKETIEPKADKEKLWEYNQILDRIKQQEPEQPKPPEPKPEPKAFTREKLLQLKQIIDKIIKS